MATSRIHIRNLVAALALCGGWIGAPVQAADAPALSPAETHRRLAEARPDGRFLEVGGLTLTRDVFELRLSGRFDLLQPVDGKTMGAVFTGSGSYALTPATEIERRHLAWRTDDATLARLTDTFDRALLLFADGTAEEILAAGQLDQAMPQAAAIEAFEDLTRVAEGLGGADVTLRQVQRLFNDDGRADGPFYAVVHGQTLDRALIGVDAMGLLGAEGTCLRVDHDTRGGFWYSSRSRAQLAAGGAAGEPLLVDALHYEIDSRVARSTDVAGTTLIDFEVLVPRLRVLPLALHDSLEVEEAALVGEPERPLEIIRTGEGSIAVAFPAPLARGDRARIRIAYRGDGILHDDGAKIYQVRGRTDWYPNAAPFHDRATYGLTFRVPKGHTVVAVGQHVKTSETGNEVVSTWRSERPIAVAGFNYGDFRRTEQHEPNTGMDLEVYATQGTPDAITEINRMLQDAASGPSFRQQQAIASNDAVVNVVNTYTGPSSIGISSKALADFAMADAINSVQILTKFFGPLDNKRLAVTQQSDWSFGQAWPSLVYLPYLLGVGRLVDIQLGIPGYAGFVDEVGIHEIAHQWWGHKVGWSSYRDNWLSEGFAEYSTALVLELTQGSAAYDAFWERRRAAVLGTPPSGGEPAYRAGPIALGFRAATERSPGAAQALTYSKGGFVLHMLRMLMRDHQQGSDERFFTMMRDFSTTYAGRLASTADFQAIVQKHFVPELNASGDGTVDWFFDQWVYGTEVPRYQADVTIEKAGRNKYRIAGTLTQSGVSEDFVALVPAYVDLGKGKLGQFGRSPFRGNMTHKLDLTLDLPSKPKAVLLNARHEVLAFD